MPKWKNINQNTKNLTEINLYEHIKAISNYK